MDRNRAALLICCPPAVGCVFIAEAVRMRTDSVITVALLVAAAILANGYGLLSAIRIVNVEDARGGAWNVIGWSAAPCYAAMLSLVMFMQGIMLAFDKTAGQTPVIVQQFSAIAAVTGMFTGLLTLPFALISLPVLLTKS